MEDYAGSAIGSDAATDFATFYRREYSRSAALAYSLSGSWAVAEELTQEAFLVAHRKWASVIRCEDPGQWVRRVVANHAVSSYRRRMAERRALQRTGSRTASLSVSCGPADATAGASGSLSADFVAKIRALPAKQAQAIALFYVDQRSVAEVAAMLGCTESTTRTHLQRGREALRSALGTSGLDE